jgi:hypothetical protein
MREQCLDMSQIAANVLALLSDTFAQYFAAWASLFDNGEIGRAGFFAIGSGFLFEGRFDVEKVDDLFTKLTGFVE